MNGRVRTTHASNMRARLCLCLGLTGFALLVPILVPLREAAAQSLEVEPGACVDATHLTAALDAIGARVATARDITLMTLRVAEIDGKVSLEVREAGVVLGGRTIETEGLPCDEVLSAVAVAMAVTTDALLDAPLLHEPLLHEPLLLDTAGAPAAPLPRAAHHALSSRPHPSDSPEAAPPDGPADRGSRHVATSLELGWSLGMMPKSSATLAAMVDVAIGPAPVQGAEPELSARAGFFSALPSGTGDAGPDGGEIVTSVFAGRLDLCGGVGSSLVRLRGCASAVGGGLVTQGGEDDGRLVAGGRIDLRWRVFDRLGLQAGADMLANLAPSHVTSRDVDARIAERKLGAFALVVGGGPVVEFF